MTAVAPLEIRTFFELVNKARVVEDCAKKVAEAKGNRSYTDNRGRGNYLAPRGQNFKRNGEGKWSRAYSPGLRCQECGNYHPHTPCRLDMKLCYKCGALGHLVRDCLCGGTQEAGRSQQYS
ncbi:hypothetical protein Ahy_B06g082543 [Arachis hypogaea]|uniref:CCHC-type domain-containing protein n=1 Tax=Arachis hypogaea TaxID=3818 RepID=A0A444YNP5_ARAHY|nr:hypothetical protein Ahy_B06g082543 [Arachis hypogaea]